jgi:hypothetical protein
MLKALRHYEDPLPHQISEVEAMATQAVLNFEQVLAACLPISAGCKPPRIYPPPKAQRRFHALCLLSDHGLR